MMEDRKNLFLILIYFFPSSLLMTPPPLFESSRIVFLKKKPLKMLGVRCETRGCNEIGFPGQTKEILALKSHLGSLDPSLSNQ